MPNNLDPNLLLQIRPQADIGRTFNNILTNIGNFDQIKQNRAQAPIRQQLLQQQADRGQAASNIDKRSALTNFASQIKPMLDSGDIAGVRQLTQQQQSGPLGGEANQFLQLLDSNPQLAKQRVDQVVKLGKQSGELGDRGGLTNKQRELEQFRNLPESTDEERAFKKQFGQAIGAISKLQTVESKLNLEAGKADIKTNQALDEAQRIENETVGGRQKTQAGQLRIDETKFKNEEARKIAVDAKNIRRNESDGAVTLVKELLDGDLFSDAFGRFNNAPSEGLRTQANIDARAQVDRINGLLSLESRQKLKGSGTISDGEQKILGQSATILLNPLISDDVARRELRRVQRVFEDASDRNRLKQETKDIEAQQQEQTQVLRFDAQGNLIQ